MFGMQKKSLNMELQFYKKGEDTESGDVITTYYVLGEKMATLIMVNKQPPLRCIVTCLPANVEISPQMERITPTDFLEVAQQSSDALNWYATLVAK